MWSGHPFISQGGLLGSDCSEGWSHAIDDMAVIAAGGLLRSPAGHLRSKTNRNLSDVLLTCMHAVDPEITEVGAAEMRSTTLITEIMR